ncbi:GSCOCG00007656001-RA-CDS [Cotesia congregata]|nr:GSCOCG00007656001-RA-CDS [Cotesia congregata]
MSNNYGYLNNDESNESEFKRNPVRRSLRLRLTRVFSSGSLKSPKSPGYSSLSDSPNSPEISSAIKTRYSWQNNNLKNILSNSPRSSISSTSCNDSINSLTFMESIKPPENNDENKRYQLPFMFSGVRVHVRW